MTPLSKAIVSPLTRQTWKSSKQGTGSQDPFPAIPPSIGLQTPVPLLLSDLFEVCFPFLSNGLNPAQTMVSLTWNNFSRFHLGFPPQPIHSSHASSLFKSLSSPPASPGIKVKPLSRSTQSWKAHYLYPLPALSPLPGLPAYIPCLLSITSGLCGTCLLAPLWQFFRARIYMHLMYGEAPGPNVIYRRVVLS